MTRYLLGFSLALLGLFVCCVTDQWAFMTHEAQNWGIFAAKIAGVPIGAAWIIAELVEWIRPRKMFDRRSERPWRLLGTGFVAGLLSIGGALLIYATIGWRWNDAVVFGSSSACVSVVLLLPRRIVRAGRCVSCGYELKGLVEPRCPECGTFW